MAKTWTNINNKRFQSNEISRSPVPLDLETSLSQNFNKMITIHQILNIERKESFINSVSVICGGRPIPFTVANFYRKISVEMVKSYVLDNVRLPFIF